MFSWLTRVEINCDFCNANSSTSIPSLFYSRKTVSLKEVWITQGLGLLNCHRKACRPIMKELWLVIFNLEKVVYFYFLTSIHIHIITKFVDQISLYESKANTVSILPRPLNLKKPQSVHLNYLLWWNKSMHNIMSGMHQTFNIYLLSESKC